MVSLNNSFPTILLGRPSKFLGVWFHYEPNGDIFLHQLPFAMKVLQRFGMGGNTHTRKAPGPALRSNATEGELCEQPMAEACGCINWLVNNTRPDMAHHINAISQGVSKPTVNGWKLVKWLLQYLSGCPARGLWYRRAGSQLCTQPYCYVDASLDQVSIGGYLLYSFGGLVNWKCYKIKGICRSSFESEIVTMSAAAATITWYSRVLKALSGEVTEPIPLYCDNQGSIDSAGNSRQSTRTRHITQHDLFIREAVKQNLVLCVKVDTKENWADYLTKPLGPDEFKRQIDRMEMDPPSVVWKPPAKVWEKPSSAEEEL